MWSFPQRVTTVTLKSSTQKAVVENDEMLIGLKIDVHEDAGPWEIFWTQLGRWLQKTTVDGSEMLLSSWVGSLYLSHYSQGFIFYTSQVVVSNFFHRKFCPPENERMSPIKELWWKDISSSNIFQPSIVRDMLVLKGGRML